MDFKKREMTSTVYNLLWKNNCKIDVYQSKNRYKGGKVHQSTALVFYNNDGQPAFVVQVWDKTKNEKANG